MQLVKKIFRCEEPLKCFRNEVFNKGFVTFQLETEKIFKVTWETFPTDSSFNRATRLILRVDTHYSNVQRLNLCPQKMAL